MNTVPDASPENQGPTQASPEHIQVNYNYVQNLFQRVPYGAMKNSEGENDDTPESRAEMFMDVSRDLPDDPGSILLLECLLGKDRFDAYAAPILSCMYDVLGARQALRILLHPDEVEMERYGPFTPLQPPEQPDALRALYVWQAYKLKYPQASNICFEQLWLDWGGNPFPPIELEPTAEPAPAVEPTPQPTADHLVAAFKLTQRAKAEDNPQILIDGAETIAHLGASEYQKLKNLMKEHFKKRLNLRDLSRAVIEAQKALGIDHFTTTLDGLPQVVVTNRPLRAITDDTLHILEQRNDPPTMFVRKRALTRIATDERGAPVIEALRDHSLRGILTRSANFIKLINKAKVHVHPGDVIVNDLLSLDNPPFPTLVGITEVPVIRPDGSILGTPGYDPATQLLYAPANGLVVPPIPDHPSTADIQQALALLLDAIGDFPFVDDASQANALAALLTPIMRPAIDGPIPLGLVDKPAAGTGASLLVEIMALIATGRAASLMSAPSTEDEWRKQITSVLDMGANIVIIDNVESTLRAAGLSMALTSTTWRDRRLGKNETIDLPQRASWFATGINIRLGGDLPRRCYWIRMDAKMARPWERKGFKHPKLRAWVAGQRGELVAAILTLGRAWFTSGKPAASTPIIGSFEGWAETIGGILGHAGVKGFLGNMDELYSQADEETQQWEGFLAHWHALYGDNPMLAADIAKSVHEGTGMSDVMPDSITDEWSGDPRNLVKRLGKALAKKDGNVFGDYRLRRSRQKDSHTKHVMWYVEKIA